MSKLIPTNITKGIVTFVKKRNPEILTGIGVAGMVTTTVLAVKATPKALILIESKKEDEEVDKLTVLETVKTVWPCYIPAVVTGTMSIFCIVGATSANARRNAALATAYTLSESAAKEYRDKVIETVGEKKDKEIRDAISKDRIERDPVKSSEIVFTDRGDTLCYDVISGRYFKSDIDKLKKVVNELNRQMLKDSYISLNDFYDSVGLEHIKMGYDLGWNISDGLIDLDFSSHLATDGTPCVVLDFSSVPKYDFDRYM